MTLTKARPPQLRKNRSGDRAGDVVSIIVNAALLGVVDRLLDWGWPSFLTDEFNDVVGWIRLSLIVGIIVSAICLVYRAGWFYSLMQVVTLTVSLAATARLLQVFPFDFSTYAVDWAPWVRAGLVLVVVASVIAVVVNGLKFLARLAEG